MKIKQCSVKKNFFFNTALFFRKLSTFKIIFYSFFFIKIQQRIVVQTESKTLKIKVLTNPLIDIPLINLSAI